MIASCMPKPGKRIHVKTYKGNKSSQKGNKNSLNFLEKSDKSKKLYQAVPIEGDQEII